MSLFEKENQLYNPPPPSKNPTVKFESYIFSHSFFCLFYVGNRACFQFPWLQSSSYGESVFPPSPPGSGFCHRMTTEWGNAYPRGWVVGISSSFEIRGDSQLTRKHLVFPYMKSREEKKKSFSSPLLTKKSSSKIEKIISWAPNSRDLSEARTNPSISSFSPPHYKYGK